MSVLEDKYATISDLINIDNGTWMLKGRRILDAERSPKSVMTIKESFEHSSNVAMAKLAYNYYSSNPAKFYQHYVTLGLTSRTGIDLNEEFRPTVKNPKLKGWHLQTLPSMGFGYEVMLSPLQLLTVYNAVANDGRLMKPYLVNDIEKDGNILREFEPQVVNENICTPETLKQLQECLRAVCTDGTAKAVFKDAAYTVAGKTGTAKVNDGKFKYNDGVYQSSFVGYFPSDKPVYSCIVVIKNKPHAVRHFGGAVAAPVFREIADKLYAERKDDQPGYIANKATDSNYYRWSGFTADAKDIFKEMKISFQDSSDADQWSYMYNNNYAPTLNALAVADNIVPDLKGMGLKDAIYLLENMKLKVQAKGSGKIMNQSPAAGTVFNKGQTITLELN